MEDGVRYLPSIANGAGWPKEFRMTATEQAHLDSLIAASEAAWKAYVGKPHTEESETEWFAAADAERSYREQIGEDWASKFEACYGYKGR